MSEITRAEVRVGMWVQAHEAESVESRYHGERPVTVVQS